MAGARHGSAVLGLVLLLAGCSSLTDGIECEAPRAVAAQPATGMLTVMSWNVHGLPFDESLGKRIDNISAAIRRERPDVVLLQEAWLDDAAGRLDCRLRRDYARVPEADGVRAGLLSLYGHRRGGLLAFVRRDSAWKVDPSVVPRFEEFEATGPMHRVFNENDAVAGKGLKHFAIGDGRLRVDVLNAHLQARYGEREYPGVRAAQLKQLLARARLATADVTLVAGDLNIAPVESALYGELTGEFDDLTAAYRRGCACATFAGAQNTERWWIDYVLARARGAVRIDSEAGLIRNAARDDPYSDHHAVWVRMAFAAAP